METDVVELLSPVEAARRLTVGRTKLFELIGRGEIATVRIGSLRRIPARSLRNYVDSLVAAQVDGDQQAGNRGEVAHLSRRK